MQQLRSRKINWVDRTCRPTRARNMRSSYRSRHASLKEPVANKCPIWMLALTLLLILFCNEIHANAEENLNNSMDVVADNENIGKCNAGTGATGGTTNVAALELPLSTPSIIDNTDTTTTVTSSKQELTRTSADEAVQKSQVETNGNDDLDDGIFDPFSPDPSCSSDDDTDDSDCTWQPPESTIETEEVFVDVACSFGGDDPSMPSTNHDGNDSGTCSINRDGSTTKKKVVHVDKHWGSDKNILKMRDKLRRDGSGTSCLSKDTDRKRNKIRPKRRDGDTNKDGNDSAKTSSSSGGSSSSSGDSSKSSEPHQNRRPPVILMPGLASTRLVSWKFKGCDHALLSDIKVQDYVWLNINLLVQMGTISADCWIDCMTLGQNQTDMDDADRGCKLRPDEGLDAISSLAPGSIGSNFLVGGTNTVYAWLIQWLADNLGYDVSSIIGLPYDWRLSPDVMEKRDGFLTLTRLRIEAAVKSNGAPAIMVAHSMGNTVFRYFLEWLKQELVEEAYARLVKKAENRAAAARAQKEKGIPGRNIEDAAATTTGWMGGAVDGLWNYLIAEGDLEHQAASGATRVSETTSNNADQHQQQHQPTNTKNKQLRQLAQIEGEDNYIEWMATYIWTYVGLSAPLLGAVNPLRAVISGENMGLPMKDDVARFLELSFGSTHTVNPISSKMGFCDDWDMEEWGEEVTKDLQKNKANLACLDDIMNDIEDNFEGDPWKDFPQLRLLLKDRVDWDTDFPIMQIIRDTVVSEASSSLAKDAAARSDNSTNTLRKDTDTINLGPRDAQTGDLFTTFDSIWKEKDEPLLIKRDQLDESFWSTPVQNILNNTWHRPHIKHVIMAYGVDVPTEAGYVYRHRQGDSKTEKKKKYDGIPKLETVIWEDVGGSLLEEKLVTVKGRSIADAMLKKKTRKQHLNGGDGIGSLLHSGDGTIPYLSLAWAHTWLLHSVQAEMHSLSEEEKRDKKKNPLDSIEVSHRPKGGKEWLPGAAGGIKEEEDDSDHDDDTGTSHPHGTKYKPLMVKYHNEGTSRTTGMEYSTTLVEAIGVEHKETTRNYDILAAVFTDVLRRMHDDFPELV